MKDIFELTEEEIKKIGEIITGYPLKKEINKPLIKKDKKGKFLEFIWIFKPIEEKPILSFIKTKENLSIFLKIRIFKNWELSIKEILGISKNSIPITNLTEYLEFIRSLN